MKVKIFYRKPQSQEDKRVWVVEADGAAPNYTEKIVIHGSIETFYDSKTEPHGYISLNLKTMQAFQDLIEIVTK